MNKPTKKRRTGPTAQRLIRQNDQEYRAIRQCIAAESPEERAAKAKQALEDIWGEVEP